MTRNTLAAGILAAVLAPAVLAAQGTDAAYVAAATAAAPAAISGAAAVIRIDAKGAVTTVRPGTNGFTCFVGVPGDPDAPFCGDQNALDWVLSVARNAPAPTNTAPGVAYMGKGGMHHETATRDVVMMPGAGTHMVHEPPHWMVMWRFDPATSGLPTKENPGGVYIMFAGTPYAHLMVYQDPAAIGR
jgi:hypothetical protein